MQKELLMCFRILFLLSGCVLFAADRPQAALDLRAQADFDRVAANIPTQIQDAEHCIQSQVAAISVSGPSGLSSLYFREGFCRLAEATVTRRAADYQDAAAALKKSIDWWPDAGPFWIARSGSPCPASNTARGICGSSKT